MSISDVAWRTSGADRAVLVDAALVCVGAALLLLPSLIHGAPTGDDYPHHAPWVEAFTAEQSLSRLYPRWLETLWFGAGGADFFFYAPLAYWLAAAVEAVGCAHCGTGTLLAAVGLVALVVSGLGFRALGLRFGGRWPALVAAVIFMALPYHLGADWYHRLALAEFTAMAVLPWHLAAFVDCLRGRRRGPLLALLSSFLALAHLPTALIVGIGYGALLFAVKRAPGWRPLGTSALAGAVGLGLAAFYWYPAITLIDSVRADQLGGPLVPVANWLISPNIWRNALLEAHWISLVGLSVVAVAILLAAPPRARAARAPVAVLVVVTWVMVTPTSYPLWVGTPVAQIQFPWRFLVLSDLAFGLAALMAAETLARRDAGRVRRGVAAASLGAIVVFAALAHPAIYETRARTAVPKPDAPVLAGAFEWLPRESLETSDLVSYERWHRVLDAAREAARRPTVTIRGAGSARVLSEEPRRVTFEATLPEPAGVVLHRTYWRFWQLENLDSGETITVAPTDSFPLVSATLPAGAARYRLALPTLPEERLGILASGVSLLILLGWWWASRSRRQP